MPKNISLLFYISLPEMAEMMHNARMMKKVKRKSCKNAISPHEGLVKREKIRYNMMMK